MRCIYCSKKTTYVSDSREHTLGVRRRRRCTSCDASFTTTETALSENLFISKRSGKRQRFRRDKLFVSIFTAVLEGKHKDNGTASVRSTIITDAVCRQLLDQKTRTVSSAFVAQITYDELCKLSSFLAQKYRLYSQYRTENITESSSK